MPPTFLCFEYFDGVECHQSIEKNRSPKAIRKISSPNGDSQKRKYPTSLSAVALTLTENLPRDEIIEERHEALTIQVPR